MMKLSFIVYEQSMPRFVHQKICNGLHHRRQLRSCENRHENNYVVDELQPEKI